MGAMSTLNLRRKKRLQVERSLSRNQWFIFRVLGESIHGKSKLINLLNLIFYLSAAFKSLFEKKLSLIAYLC